MLFWVMANVMKDQYEAVSSSKFNLEKLNVIIDRNNYQQTGANKEILDLGNLSDKFFNFGWDTHQVDGHNLKKLLDTLIIKNNKKKMLIANTIKGKGFSFSEDNNTCIIQLLRKKYMKLH